ncbi:hypothetical protein [Variovorax sp. CY25R-8]|jgi:hypothetical protein|uniref:hypothetical protein n=1 Tax=Variovorax sp. CY25R-8 TaxID=2855501 RepID=UPI0021BABD8A|nr:hypothetical protein [Variovorax sp. CY25R-8]MCT8175448.1 hypothetical protein [Variovorax sp. CY25R-8]
MDRIEKAICAEVMPPLRAQGFELNKKWGCFVREQPFGCDKFMIVNQGTALGKFFEITAFPEIRHDRIEIPWNTLGMVYGDAQLETCTLVFGQPRGPASPMKVAPATMQEDVETVAREIEAIFASRALLFYERFADLVKLEAFANAKPLADIAGYSLGLPLEHRAMRSLLLAKAVNPGRYPVVREAFVNSPQKTWFPREKCLDMLRRVDEMQV